MVGGNKLYPYIPLSTRAERKEQLIEQEVAFERGKPKHRYVGVYAPNRRIKRAILEALRWKTFPYPKRGSQSSGLASVDTRNRKPAKLPLESVSLNLVE